MPAAIPRPQLPEAVKNLVKYPAAPANPPTIEDMAAGIRLACEVLTVRSQYRPSHGVLSY
jgi:hypothetical protein